MLGDVVGSRRLRDRAAAQRDINTALERVSRTLGPVQQLEPTIGDEFQGGFETLESATRASLHLRLELLPEVDVRIGIGVGEVTVHDASRHPLLQDGPGWWAAREALEGMSSRRRTWYVGPSSGRVNAFLTARDALVDQLSDRRRRMLLMVLHGQSQTQIATAEGISPSAVSQALARGVGAVRDAQVTFEQE